MFEQDILGGALPEYPRCHCPTIALTEGGDVLIAWYAYAEKETQGAILVYTLRRAGKDRFERPRRILAHLTYSLGNPVLFLGLRGRVHLLFVSLKGYDWVSADVYVTHSDDTGATWSLPTMLRLPQGTMVRHPPIALNGSGYLLPGYDEKSGESIILKSDASAQRWSECHRFADGEAIQGCFALHAGGALTMMLRPTGDDRHCLRAISADSGSTWSPLIRTSLPNPLSGLAVFAVDDAMCVVYNHTSLHRRYPLSLAFTRDRGVSWSAPKHIDETRQEVSYPAFVIDCHGVAHGVYTLARTRIRYVTFDRQWWEG